MFKIIIIMIIKAAHSAWVSYMCLRWGYSTSPILFTSQNNIEGEIIIIFMQYMERMRKQS